MYENMTFDVIMKRILDRIPNTFDKREGSVIYDAIAPAAVEFRLAYIELDQILNESFADTASREYAIRRCKERGIIPQEATNAILKGEFTPTDLNLIGERFNLDKLNYIVISGENGVYNLECETPGTEGNGQLGTLIPIGHINGLQTAKLTELLIPARDEESIESLKERYFNSFSEKAFGGNRADYIAKTNDLLGVAATKVTPLWDGPGTVKLTIQDETFSQAGDELIKSVQSQIDPTQDGTGYGIAPIGHIVTVDTVEEVPINVVANITFDKGYDWDTVKGDISKAVNDYILELRAGWGDSDEVIVYVTQVESRIIAIEGITNAEVTINKELTKVQLKWNQIPKTGDISGGDS